MKNNNINMQNTLPNNGQVNNNMGNTKITNMPNNNVKNTGANVNNTMNTNMQINGNMKNSVSNNINNINGNVYGSNNKATITASGNSANNQGPIASNNVTNNRQVNNNMNNNIQNSIPINKTNNNVSNNMKSSVNRTLQRSTNVTNSTPSNAIMPNNVQKNANMTPSNVNGNTKGNVQDNKQVSNVTKNNISNNMNTGNSNMVNNNTANTQRNNINNKMQVRNIDFTKMPVVDVVNYIIITAVNAGASDIHFDPTDRGITVRLRIDGLLNDYFFLPFEIKQNVITRMKIMAGMNITETRLPQDGGIRDRISGRDLDLRVSSLPTKRGEKIVIRILDYTMSLEGIESLCFSETNYNKILKMINSPNGIILVTGATGTGKSTTLYSFLQKLNVEGTNIITVEDPVEMDIAGINQVQVNSDIGLDFAAVLRSILRQDPNIIMIGEIRDSETAKIAVRASITGHLVLSTIHTNNSLNTIERLLDMEVERYLLASALTGIVSQQLARKLCDKCKVKREVSSVEKGLFENVLGFDVKEVFEPNKNGCPNCSRGYRGRIALQEVLLINQDIRDAISSGMRKEQLRGLVYNKDVITMLQDGLYKVMAGFTTTSEVLKLIEVEDENFGIK